MAGRPENRRGLEPRGRIEKGPAYVLREAGVELRMTDRQTVGDAILSGV